MSEQEVGSFHVAELVGKLLEQGVDEDTIRDMFEEALEEGAEDE